MYVFSFLVKYLSIFTTLLLRDFKILLHYLNLYECVMTCNKNQENIFFKFKNINFYLVILHLINLHENFRLNVLITRITYGEISNCFIRKILLSIS